MFFAVHPLQTESLGWISGGKDVLSGTLSLIALWMYVNFSLASSRSSHRIASYILATLAFIAATLAKPQAVAVPAVAIVLDWLLVGRPLRKVLVSIAPWLACCIPVILIGQRVQAPIQLHTEIWFRAIVAADAIAFYFGKMFLPIGLAVDYSRSPAWLLASPARFWTWLVPAILFAISLLVYRRARWPLTALLIFVAALAPVLGFLRFDYQAYSTVADHYVYLAMLGPALAITFGLSMIRWKIWITGALLLVLAMSLLSWRQSKVWLDTFTLFKHTYEINPHSLAAAGQLGMYLRTTATRKMRSPCSPKRCASIPNCRLRITRMPTFCCGPIASAKRSLSLR